MNEKNLKIRSEAVCATIVKENVSFVFLQEVTPDAEKIVRQNLSNKYVILSGNVNSAPYYTMTLVDKNPGITVENNVIVNFKETLMGRNIIKTNVTHYNVHLMPYRSVLIALSLLGVHKWCENLFVEYSLGKYQRRCQSSYSTILIYVATF